MMIGKHFSFVKKEAVIIRYHGQKIFFPGDKVVQVGGMKISLGETAFGYIFLESFPKRV